MLDFIARLHFSCPRMFVYRMETDKEPLVKTAANIFKDLCYNYRDQLMAGIICAGWDAEKGGQVCLPFMVLYTLV